MDAEVQGRRNNRQQSKDDGQRRNIKSMESQRASWHGKHQECISWLSICT